MAIIRGLFRALMLALLSVPASALAQDDSDRFLRRGAYLDGQIWLLTDRGNLFRIDERTRRRTDENLPGEVLDICRRDGELLAVTGLRDVGGWTVRRRSRGAWRIIGRIDRSEDELGAMDCTASAPVTLLTTSRVIEIGNEGPRVVGLSSLIHARVRLTTFGTAQHLYVGLNSGEWGGGILRVDRATGQVGVSAAAPAQTTAAGAHCASRSMHLRPSRGGPAAWLQRQVWFTSYRMVRWRNSVESTWKRSSAGTFAWAFGTMPKAT